MVHLHALPYEVLERTVFWTANNDYTHTPVDLVSFVLTCRLLHDAALGTPSCPNYGPLANVARFRYSTAAPRRRLGPVAVTNACLAAELICRVPTLRRVRLGDIHGPDVLADLWVIFFMCIEDDGRNGEQLAYAGAERWVCDIIRARIFEQTDPWGWPVESELSQVAVFVYAILATRAPPSNPELERERDEILYILTPFAVAAHRYPIAYLPEALRVVSANALVNLANAAHTPLADPADPNVPPHLTLAAAPISAPTHIPRPLWGHSLTLTRPPVAVSAILAGRIAWSVDGRSGSPNTNSMTAFNSTRFDSDFRRLVLAHVAVTQEAWWPNDPAPVSRPNSDARSNDEFLTTLTPSPLTDTRLAACWVGLGRLWAPGMLSGLWDGGCLIPSFQWYTGMLAMHPYMPNFAFGSDTLPDPAYQPMRFIVREHVSTDIAGHVGAGGDVTGESIRNAWLPAVESGQTWMLEKDNQLLIYDPYEPDPEYAMKRYHTVRLGGGNGTDYSVDMEMPVAGPLPKFPRVVGRGREDRFERGPRTPGIPPEVNVMLDEAMAETECISRVRARVADEVEMEAEEYEGVDAMDATDEEGGDLEPPLRVDVIITGEDAANSSQAEAEHARRWGACKLYGRVRSNDGLLVFVRVPAAHMHGRWIFRAYPVGGCALAGRWRETGTSMAVAGYEGTFVLKKVAR